MLYQQNMILWCYSMKKRRVCLVFNNEFYQKLRSIQSDKIKETNRALSLSQLVEDLVKNGMENESISQISKWFSEIIRNQIPLCVKTWQNFMDFIDTIVKLRR